MIKTFEQFNNQDIDAICKKYNIKNYTIRHDGKVNVDGDVNLNDRCLSKLPLEFGIVTGDFLCKYNELTSLEGAPDKVGGSIDCGENTIESLKYSSKEVGGDFICTYNRLTTLEGAPEYIGKTLDCSYNDISSLKGCPEIINGDFFNICK